ncbi:hypothetical protein [uncultured Tateyamaria sp.]|uniref:hypothetical protein n=2 Tax=uncultured Tateyamaria sp. TaxID=455651 RepID=UPI00260CA23B|nr:hypothetical protein [uncultured Tateyamaria sp.]
MALVARHILGALSLCGLAMPATAGTHPAIDAFVSYCFKAGQTVERARVNMESLAGAPLPFDLTFWDKSLEPAPGTPDHAERRCAVEFQGNHAADAVAAVQAKMAEQPVFGTPISLPAPYTTEPGTAYLEGRALLRGRVAVVHVGTRQGKTFIAVDRLPEEVEISDARRKYPNGWLPHRQKLLRAYFEAARPLFTLSATAHGTARRDVVPFTQTTLSPQTQSVCA